MCSLLTIKLFSATGLIALCVGAGPAEAAIVGKATEITDLVTGGFGAKLGRMKVNDPVLLQQTVRTASGEGRFMLDENTVSTVFSRSSIKVARFAPTNVVMSTADGTFEVTTGHLTPGSYRFDTTAGLLTPHGTRLWFSVRGARLKLDVQEGAVTFCPRGKSKAYCVDAVPGRELIVGAVTPPPRRRRPSRSRQFPYRPPGQWPVGCRSATGYCGPYAPPPPRVFRSQTATDIGALLTARTSAGSARAPAPPRP